MLESSLVEPSFIVITSINKPNKALKNYADGAFRTGQKLVIIGDGKSPADFRLKRADFFSLKDQTKLNFSLAKLSPVGHYARKNIGYLVAVRSKAKKIIDADDDNLTYPKFWEEASADVSSHHITGAGWTNVYRYFTKKTIWPRGFPLNKISLEAPKISKKLLMNDCPIQQGLVNEDPDVDAIYRLAFSLPFRFEKSNKPVAMGRGTWCPFNSQNTTWFKKAFPLLYLPVYCSGRMTDIWRSFVAQRICWENGWNILFKQPTVWQDRNPHNLMRDFSEEVSGYLQNEAICSTLEALQLTSGADAIFDNLMRCYEALVKLKVFPRKELSLVRAWISDFQKCGYS